jgi:serine phosphatase RsbU (regulator of sigma subunit)
MSRTDDLGQRGVPMAPKGAGEGGRASAPVHLPTWSRLDIAAKQSAPTGNGGDFFEVIQQRDGRVTVAMADVCGNGPSAAAPVSSLRWILRQTIARGEAPGAVLAALNDWIVAQRIDDRFVTAVCVRIDAVTGRAELASAGHLGPFIKRAAGGADELPHAVGLALGILSGQVYQETSVELAPQDALVLVTDGITDRLATSADQLGQRALVERLARAGQGSESICRALLGSDARATEDATVLVVQMPRRHRRATPVARAG